MKKCLIVFYSLSGTTSKIAELLVPGLSSEYSVDLINITEHKNIDYSNYDLIGIGTPVYYYRPSYPILEAMEDLPDLMNKPVFTFLLFGMVSFDAFHYLERIIQKKNGRIIGHEEFTGEDLFYGYMKLGYLFSPDRPSKDDFSKAREYSQAILENLKGNNIKVKTVRPGIVYVLERFSFTRLFNNYIHTYMFRAANACDACGICVKSCPMNNVTIVNGKPVWGHNCIGCYNCELKCPKEAITSSMDFCFLKPFFKYNISHAIKRKIDFVRIELKAGKVKKL